jgi:hypothetical protein
MARGRMAGGIERLTQRTSGDVVRHHSIGQLHLRRDAAIVDPTVGVVSLIQVFRGFKDDFCGSVVPEAWTSTVTNTGSVYMAQSAHGGDIILATGATINSTAQIDFNASAVANWGTNCISAGVGVTSFMFWKMQLNSNANIWIQMGLTRVSATESILVTFDTSVPDATWQLDCTDAGGTTTVDTGIGPDDVDHWYKLTISSNLVCLYIDDMINPVAENRDNITAWNMEPVFYIQNLAAADKRINLDFVAIIPDAGVLGV